MVNKRQSGAAIDVGVAQSDGGGCVFGDTAELFGQGTGQLVHGLVLDVFFRSFVQKTEVEFYELSDETIDKYIGTLEPMDKAGAYGIQGGAALFAQKLVGDYYNVMGLPVCRLGMILRTLTEES